MIASDIVEFKKCHLIAVLPDDQREAAIELIHPTVAEFPPKSIIFRAEEFAPSFIFILAGNVTVERKEGGKRVLLNKLSSGDSFGAASMFGGEGVFPTRVQAKTNVRIAAVDESSLTELFHAYPAAAVAHIRFLSEKIRFLNRKIAALTGRDAESKVSNYILKTYGKETSQGRLNMAQTARFLDLGRASLYRIISQLDDAGIIRYQDGFIEIIKINELERLSK